MRIGAITNSWGLQINRDKLPDLVCNARDRGAKHIELRQTFLGACESGKGHEWRPVIGNLQSLVNDFPELSFNLAMAIPCLSGGVSPDGPLFQRGLEAARVVGREHPHLRLVDPVLQEKTWESHDYIIDVAPSITALARESSSQGVTLSLENTCQSIRTLSMLIEECRERLSKQEGQFLGLCPDPTNQIQRHPETDPLADLEALSLDMLKIVHFKQVQEGRVIQTVDDGDLDCVRMAQILYAKGYAGPAIFEIPSHEAVFDNLSSSFDYLERIVSTF